MANTKISALTSATTPLAGTEVLPIVQSSTTVKVATNDLTVRNFRANATTGILQVTGPAASTTRVMTVPNANFTAARTDASQTFTGDQTFSSAVVGGNFQTSRGQGTVPASGTATILTLSSSVAGTYFISASFGPQGNQIYGGMAIVVANGGSFRLQYDGSGSRCTITLSGANVQITNALGVPLTAQVVALYVTAE
jgi:hypothetical protein